MEEEQGFVETMASSASRPVKKRLARIGLTGAWLTQMPSKLNGTLLSKDEFCDNVRLRYGMRPTNLCERCDGCGAGFLVDHALSCKKGGLVCQRHDSTRDEAGSLAANALTPSRVSYEPHFFLR